MRRDDKPDPLEELADHVAEMVEPYLHVERYFDQVRRRTRLHVRKMPSLLDQLRAAADPANTATGPEVERRPGGFESRAAANVDAADRLRAIGEQLGRWLGRDRVADRDLEDELRKLVGIAAAGDATAAAKAVKRWWTWCRILGGWQDPPWKPPAPCMACGIMPGDHAGLRVWFDIEWARCLSCGAKWGDHEIHDLAGYIRGRTWDRSMTVEIITWLRAQLDEDERVARSVRLAGPWSPEGGSVWGEGLHLVVQGGYPEDANHIARHDPARVLAEVAAKRRILDDFADLTANTDRHEVEALHLTWTLLGAIVRRLAVPYADRPGYDEEWRP